MDGRVLPDFERREVEAERADLPAQFRHFAVGDPLEPVRHERVGDLCEFGLQLLRPGVSPRQRGRFPDQCRPRPTQPLGDEPEPLPVRLVRESAAELSVGLGQVLGVARKARHEGPCHAVAGRRRGDRLHQPGRDRLVPAQDVVGVDAHGPCGDLRGDARVAVAVATDPAARPQERADARRPRPGPAGVGRRGRRPTGRRIQGRIERPVQPRDDREQRGVEEGHRGPDLVERGRADDAQVGRPPQQRDLLAQPAPNLAIVRRGEPGIVQPGEQDGTSPQGNERRPPARLGRMRREDRRDDEPADQRIELRVRSAQPPQPRHRVRE